VTVATEDVDMGHLGGERINTVVINSSIPLYNCLLKRIFL
jgi:hypothetical protein